MHYRYRLNISFSKIPSRDKTCCQILTGLHGLANPLSPISRQVGTDHLSFFLQLIKKQYMQKNKEQRKPSKRTYPKKSTLKDDWYAYCYKGELELSKLDQVTALSQVLYRLYSQSPFITTHVFFARTLL